LKGNVVLYLDLLPYLKDNNHDDDSDEEDEEE
jgi:hypothetical protein